MIVKVPIYVELIGKVDPTFLKEVVNHLQDDFYKKLRNRKISKVKLYDLAGFDITLTQEDIGINDIRLLDTEEALDSLRVKR